jgi:hypothetical protein
MKFGAFVGTRLSEELGKHAIAEGRDYFTKKSLFFGLPRGVG